MGNVYLAREKEEDILKHTDKLVKEFVDQAVQEKLEREDIR
jgi:hypothetical protein